MNPKIRTRKPRTSKRADAKNSLPIGINYAAVYYKNGKVIHRGRVRASYGERDMKSFSILKYGKAQAIKLAIKWREEQLAKRG